MSVEAYDLVARERTLEILARRRALGTLRRRGWLVRRALCVADVFGLSVAFIAALAVVGTSAAENVPADAEFALFAATLPLWVVVAKLYGLYDRDEERTDHSTTDDVAGVFNMVTVGTWLFYAGSWATGLAHPQVGRLVCFWLLAVVSVTAGRAGARAFCRRQIEYLQNTIVVGAGDVGQLIAHKLVKHPEYGLNLVGFVDAHPKTQDSELAHVALLGSPDDLPALVSTFDVERVIVAFSNESHEQTLLRLRELGELDVQVDVVPRLFELVAPGVSVHTVEGLPLIGLTPPTLSRSSKLLKRALDLVLSAAGLVVLAPLFLVVALLVKRDSPGAVFFTQVRMGEGGRTFRIVKFRTMHAGADSEKDALRHLNRHGLDATMFKCPDDPRITRLGHRLRRTSIDELPQLWNVLRGEMSLVGPRPLVLEEANEVTEWGRKRLSLKPGITGLWQVLGSSTIAFEEMVNLDYLYVTSWSLSRDIGLILRTVPLVFRRGNA